MSTMLLMDHYTLLPFSGMCGISSSGHGFADRWGRWALRWLSYECDGQTNCKIRKSIFHYSSVLRRAIAVTLCARQTSCLSQKKRKTDGYCDFVLGHFFSGTSLLLALPTISFFAHKSARPPNHTHRLSSIHHGRRTLSSSAAASSSSSRVVVLPLTAANTQQQ